MNTRHFAVPTLRFGGFAQGDIVVKRFLAFIGIGSFFATVEEFLTVVVLKRDPGSYIFTLVILFPVFLTLVYFSSRLLDRLVRGKPAQELAHYFVYGVAGLMIEWFLIGLAPWSNPNANPALMFVFQLGMFSFWATVAFAPRLFINPDELSGKIGKSILKFYVPYFILVYIVSLLVPPGLRFVTIISTVIFGYLFLNLFYINYFRQAFSRNAPSPS
jgi:hypothetical protein